ncbi:recombinase family protein [Kaistella antarctica]|uniref:Resolvase, N terminal domain n=1 Tax=Kaistella antarctica TaxID=266748 RepID=A0A3S4YKQ7_9FLAO|nr:recombinase family protein [Kaistella antarctica]SEV81544.1 Site-specific DNA recombinase [Kaistella antarctica]VEI00358.1 Resolvase, N terminal domain [Kaistella antarctica]
MLGIYARVSQEEDTDHSLKVQVDLGTKYAKEKNLEFLIYEDNGISGTLSIDQRPELLRLVSDINSGLINQVFAIEQSRLEREPIVWMTLFKLFQDTGTKLHFYNQGDFDFESDNNYLMSNFLSVANAFYVKTTKKKVKKALLYNVEQGKVHASPPYGYTKDDNKFLVVDEDEKPIVEYIFKQSLSGIGTNKIAELLNEKKVPTSYSKLPGEYKYLNKDTGVLTIRKKSDSKWAGKTIQGIIKNTFYKGKRYWQGQFYDVPAIISEEYWQRVNDNLIKNRNNSGKKVTHKYLLKGKITCARCGRNYTGLSRVNKNDHVYRCSSKRIKGHTCENGGINIDKIENVIWSYFFEKKEVLNLINSGSSSKNERILENENQIKLNKKRYNALISERDKLVNFITKGIVSENEAKKEVERIRKGIQETETELKILNQYSALIESSKELLVNSSEDFNNFSSTLTFVDKKEVINKYIKRIFLNLLDIKKRSFAIKIDFNFGIDSEKYYLSGDFITSITRKKIIQINGIVQNEICSLDEFNNLVLYTSNGIVAKPWMNFNNTIIPIINPFYPYGVPQDWNLENLIEFYQLNPEWLSPITGTNIYCMNENEFNYTWFVENYTLYKNKPLREWFIFLLSFDLKVEQHIIKKGIPISKRKIK